MLHGACEEGPGGRGESPFAGAAEQSWEEAQVCAVPSSPPVLPYALAYAGSKIFFMYVLSLIHFLFGD